MRLHEIFWLNSCIFGRKANTYRKTAHYQIVRDHVAVGMHAADLIKYRLTTRNHGFSDAYTKNVIPRLTKIFQMRKFMSIIRHLNQALVDATVILQERAGRVVEQPKSCIGTCLKALLRTTRICKHCGNV